MARQLLADEFSHKPGGGEAYVRGYNRGFYARGDEPMERADAAGAGDAWYDGYADAGAGRRKWHLPRCKAHHNGPGGCGEA